MQYNVHQAIKRVHDSNLDFESICVFGRIVVRRFELHPRFEAFLIDEMTMPAFFETDKSVMIEIVYPSLLDKMVKARVPRQAGGSIAYNFDAYATGTLSRSGKNSSIVLMTDLVELVLDDESDSHIKVIP